MKKIITILCFSSCFIFVFILSLERSSAIAEEQIGNFTIAKVLIQKESIKFQPKLEEKMGAFYTSFYRGSEELSWKTLLSRRDRRGTISSLDAKEWPYRLNGLVVVKWRTKEISDPEINKMRSGTGLLIGPRYVLTAAHTLYKDRSDLEKLSLDLDYNWPESVEFYPGKNFTAGTLYDPNKKEEYCPFGKFAATTIILDQRYIDGLAQVDSLVSFKKHVFPYDYALLVLDRDIGNTIGWAGIAALPDDVLNNELRALLYGYPAALNPLIQDRVDVDVLDILAAFPLVGMNGVINHIEENNLYYDIDTQGGQSGAGLLASVNNGTYCIGVHTQGVDLNPSEISSKNNSGTRISKEHFFRIASWMEHY
ncbi:MAG: hypothetical protein HQK50_05495 [Oligoflexia bacterium]|nr:hypothetical protein [Oligoflexia bacterium]MBF0365003.1 hypothetical protein [Oligoflexia bacterium]